MNKIKEDSNFALKMLCQIAGEAEFSGSTYGTDYHAVGSAEGWKFPVAILAVCLQTRKWSPSPMINRVVSTRLNMTRAHSRDPSRNCGIDG